MFGSARIRVFISCSSLAFFSFLIFPSFSSSVYAQGTAYSRPIMIEVDNYRTYKNQLSGYGPFYVYGWVVEGSAMSGFDGKVDALAELKTDPSASKRGLMFSTYKDLNDVMGGSGTKYTPQQINDKGITVVFYNSEPGLSSDYDDIFLNDANNSVVKFAKKAEEYGFEAHWGPMRRNLDTHVSDRVSDTALINMFQAGLDGVGLQEQQQIDESCVANIVWGPHSIAGHAADSVNYTVNRLRGLAGSQPFEVDVQIMPGKPPNQGNDSCWKGDTFAYQNCSRESISAPCSTDGSGQCSYEHCHLFTVELQEADLADSVAIWASAQTERAAMVDLIKALRRGNVVPSPTPTPTLPPSFSFKTGWNQISWPNVSDKKASDVPHVCPIAVSQENLWVRPYVRNYGGGDFNFEADKTYYLKCSQEVVWTP